MPSDHTPSRFTTLMVGAAAITASVITAAVTGSVISKGDLVFDTADNAIPAVVVNTTDLVEFASTSLVEVNGTMSGLLLRSGTGLIVKDTDGSGCSAIHVKNGVVTAQVHDC